MENILQSVIFSTIDPPNIRISRPKWVQLPSAMQVFAFIMLTYFMITAGIIYDIINEPPSIGSVTDERGQQRPAAIMANRVNGQYIMEGLAAAFMFSLGGAGFILLDKCNDANTARLHRLILLSIAIGSVCVSFMATRMFMIIKMPGYGK